MRVPSNDSLQINPNQAPVVRFNPGQAQAAPIDPSIQMNLQQFQKDTEYQARAFTQNAQQRIQDWDLINHVADYAIQYAQKIKQDNDKAIVDSRLLKLQDAVTALQLDPNEGFKNIHGEHALKRPDGMSLVDEYGGKFDHAVGDLTAELNNPEQVEMFQQAVGGMRASYMNNLVGHVQRENAQFQVDTGNAVVNGAVNDFKLATTEEDRNAAAQRIASGIGHVGQLLGWSPEQIADTYRNKMGDAIQPTITSLIDAGDFATAKSILEQYGTGADADTYLKAQDLIEKSQAQAQGRQMGQQLADWVAAKGNGASNHVRQYVNTDGSTYQKIGGSRSWRNNNEGNIRYGDFAKKHGAIGADKDGFAIFPDEATGSKAQEKLIFESQGGKHLSTQGDYGQGIGYRDKTLSQMITAYAPPEENPTDQYIANVKRRANVSDKRMSDYTPDERKRILDAMRVQEGWQVGTEQGTKGQIAQYTDKGVSEQTFNLSDALEQIQNIQNPVVRQAAIHSFQAATHLHDMQTKEAQAALENDVYTQIYYAGGDISQVSPSLWNQLSAKQMVQAENYGEAVRSNNESKLQHQNVEIYLALMQPENLKQTTRHHIQAMRGQLGDSWTKDLLRRWDSLMDKDTNQVKPEALLKSHIAAARFNDILINDFNINPYHTLTKDNKRMVAIIQYNAGNAIAAEEKQLGRALSEDESVALIRRLAAQQIGIGKGWFGQEKKDSILKVAPDHDDILTSADSGLGQDNEDATANQEINYNNVGY